MNDAAERKCWGFGDEDEGCVLGWGATIQEAFDDAASRWDCLLYKFDGDYQSPDEDAAAARAYYCDPDGYNNHRATHLDALSEPIAPHDWVLAGFYHTCTNGCFEVGGPSAPYHGVHYFDRNGNPYCEDCAYDMNLTPRYTADEYAQLVSERKQHAKGA